MNAFDYVECIAIPFGLRNGILNYNCILMIYSVLQICYVEKKGTEKILVWLSAKLLVDSQ